MGKNQGEQAARDNGNPYDWNTPEWHVWNDGFRSAQLRIAGFLTAAQVRKRDKQPRQHLGAHKPERMR